jgi:hypothetical protein
MMKKSTSTKVSIFVVFVLVSAIFSVNGNVYAQNESLSEALNVTEVPLDNSTNVTQTTVPVEEELLPTTTEGLVADSSTGNETGTTENVTETVPVEEELLPTTTDGLVTTNATSAAPRDETSEETSTTDDHSENATHDSTVTRDSQTILLEGESLPEGSFIHLYDSTPYKIENGHIAAKVPCNEENATAVDVLIGQAPDLAPAELEFVAPLSSPGDLCLYHVDIASDDANTITDIAIANNFTDDIDFPATSTIVLGVNEISPLGEHGHTE